MLYCRYLTFALYLLHGLALPRVQLKEEVAFFQREGVVLEVRGPARCVTWQLP